MLNSFKGFHLCSKWAIMWYPDNQYRNKLNLCMLLQLLQFNYKQLHIYAKRVFTHEISSWYETYPGWNHSCLWWNVSYCLHVVAEMKFHPGMNSSPSKRPGWNFIPRDECIRGWKKEKKTCKHLNPGLNFKMSIYFFNFWLMYSNMLSKVNKSEHNLSMNIRSFIKRQTSDTSSDNEWQRLVQRMTTSDNE